MRAQREHPPTERSNALVGIQRAQALQQFLRGRHRPSRRRIQEAQLAAAPGGQLERQRGQLDLVDLGGAHRFESLRLRPQAVAGAGRDASGAARALVGRGLRDGRGLQARETAVGIETRLARQPAVDHHAHARQRHRGLGDIGRQHDAPAAVRIRRQRQRLLLQRQLAMQRQQAHIAGGHRGQRGQRAQGIADFALAGQEHQQVAGLLRQCMLDATTQLRQQAFVASRREVRHRHRIRAPLGRQPRRVDSRRQRRAIERGRHHQQPQVRPQLRLHVERQGQAEVAGQVAFVEFVENNGRHAVQGRVVLDHPRQDALGKHFDAGGRRNLVFEADAIADGGADRLAALARHEAGGRARGHPARLQHQDAAVAAPAGLQQRQRHLGGLAGARRRLQYQPRVALERGQYLGQQGLDGKVGKVHGRQSRRWLRTIAAWT